MLVGSKRDPDVPAPLPRLSCRMLEPTLRDGNTRRAMFFSGRVPLTMHPALVVAALSCWAGAELPQVTFTTLAQGATSQIEEPRTAAIRTSHEWAKLWTEHGRIEKRPEIDFAGATVLAVFLGTRPTAGYGVEITRIEKEGAGLVVTYRERAPGPDERTAQVLTAPFHIVRIEAHTGPVRFSRAR